VQQALSLGQFDVLLSLGVRGGAVKMEHALAGSREDVGAAVLASLSARPFSVEASLDDLLDSLEWHERIQPPPSDVEGLLRETLRLLREVSWLAYEEPEDAYEPVRFLMTVPTLDSAFFMPEG